MDPISVTGLIASITGLITTTIQIIQYLNDVHDAPREWLSFSKEASSLLSLLTTLRYTVSDTNIDDPWFVGIKSLGSKDGPLDQFHQSLADLATKLRPRSSGIDFTKRILWTFDKKDIVNKLSRLERLKSLINLALSRDQIALTQAIKTDVNLLVKSAETTAEYVEDLSEKHNKTRHLDILTWLSPLTFSAKQLDTFSRCQKGSYQWLFQSSEFQVWLSTSDRIFWAPGMPGAGKTTFTAFLVEELTKRFDKQNVCILYIYLNYKEPAQDVNNILGTLLRQAIQDQTQLPDGLASVYEESKKKCIRPSLSGLSSFLHRSLDQYSKTYILIDALDEYNEDNGGRSMFMQHLRQLQDRSDVHVMVTSRWLASLQTDLFGSRLVEIRASDSDVEAYVQSQLQSTDRLRSHLTQDPSLANDIISAVVKSCQGMFLLAKLHVDTLLTKPNRRAIRNALQTLPKKLDDMYAQVIERIENQNEDDAKLAFELLSWLSCCRRSLTVAEVQHAMAIEIGQESIDYDDLTDESLLLSVCAGIVIIEEQSRVIKFIHYTTQEYFDTLRRTHSYFSLAQQYVTNICVTYLSSSDFNNGYCANADDLRTRYIRFPFYEYAAEFWSSHVREGNVEELTQETLMRFLFDDQKTAAAGQAANRIGWWSVGNDARQSGIHLVTKAQLLLTMSHAIRNGMEVLKLDSAGRTALHYAVDVKSIPAMRVLISGLQQSQVRAYAVWLSIHLAVSVGWEELLRVFESEFRTEIACGDLLCQHYLGRTALHRATLKGNTNLARQLCAMFIAVEAKDRLGMTALHIAAMAGERKVAEILLQAGARVETVDSFGYTPLLYAIQGEDRDLSKLLVDHFTPIRDDKGNAHLLTSVAFSRFEVASVLLTKGVLAIDGANRDGWTPLHIAAVQKDSKMIEMLIHHGADRSLRNSAGETARDIGFRRGMIESDLKKLEFRALITSADGSADDSFATRTDLKSAVSPIQKHQTSLTRLLLEYQGIIDFDGMEQILDMDDEEDDSGTFCETFSHSLLLNWLYEGVKGVLDLEDQILLQRDFGRALQLWDHHQGSAATLGLVSIKATWDKIHELVKQVEEKKKTPEECFPRIVLLTMRLTEDWHKVRNFTEELRQLWYSGFNTIHGFNFGKKAFQDRSYLVTGRRNSW